MSKKLTKTAYYPRNTSLHESLALKVVTRVVSDGVSLRNAVREAIKIAELNKKDIFLLLSVLQDFGMVTNGDYKNYWTTGWGEGVGEQALDSSMGTNYFASSNGKTVTAEQNQMFELFEQIEKMRTFASDEEIVQENPELEEVIATMQTTEKVITAMDDTTPFLGDEGDKFSDENAEEDLADLEESFGVKREPLFNNEASTTLRILTAAFGPRLSAEDYITLLQKVLPQVANIYKEKQGTVPFETIFHQQTGSKFPNVNWQKLAPMIQKYIPGYDPLAHVEPKNQAPARTPEQPAMAPVGASSNSRIVIAVEEPAEGLEGLPEAAPDANAPEAAPADVNVEEPDLTVEEPAGEDEVHATITPLPSELMEQAKNGPKWEINNLLSINKAEKYYTELKKQLEDVAINNPNINIDMEGNKKYDEVRNQIDAELGKIKEAIKGKEKIEKKEDKLETELKPQETVSVEEPAIENLGEQKAVAPQGIEQAEPTQQGV